MVLRWDIDVLAMMILRNSLPANDGRWFRLPA
jgi:hypothetical protein